MRPFAWGWLFVLFLAPVPGALPECAPVEEVEESERHAERRETSKLRKRTPEPPRVLPPPSPRRPWRNPDLAPERLGLWISRAHQRSPTA